MIEALEPLWKLNVCAIDAYVTERVPAKEGMPGIFHAHVFARAYGGKPPIEWARDFQNSTQAIEFCLRKTAQSLVEQHGFVPADYLPGPQPSPPPPVLVNQAVPILVHYYAQIRVARMVLEQGQCRVIVERIDEDD